MVVENTPEALEPLKEFVVRGRVNNPNGPPDSGSGRVTLANRSGRRLEAKVLPDGSFEFSGVPSDSYYINPAPAPQTFGAEPGPVHVTKDITGLELSVPGEGRLRGSIKVDGKIPAKINLSLRTVSGSGVNLNPALGPDGVFEAAVPAGEFNVAVPMVPPDYYEVKEITSGSGGSTTNKLKIGAGETGEVVVTLGKRLAESKIKVTGRLTGVDGVPGKSVFYREVRLAGGGGAFNQAIRTAEDGAFEFLDVPPGPFTLQIPDALVEIQLVARETNIGPIEVLGRPLKRLTKNLSGRIVIPEGFPAPDVRIEFSGVPGADGVRPRCEYFSSVNSAPDGSFSRSCDEGNYRVIASVFVERLYFEIQGVTNGSRDLRNELLSIGPGATESLTVTLAPRPDAAWRKVSGVVPGKGGVPITLRSGLNWARTVTNPDGTFEFARVVPDNYTVSADAGLGAVVAVDQRDIRGITLLPRAATTVTISGRIDVEGGKGIPQSMILLLTGATPPYATPSGPVYPRIKADGTFTVDIPQGSYRVALADSALPPGYRLKAIEYGATNIQDDILSVNSDARNLRIVLTAPPPQPGVRVAGRVEGLANLGAAQRVILYRDLPFWTDTTAMAADGAFEFSDVPPGTYRIYLETLPRAQILVRVGREDVGGVTVAAPAGPTQQK
jgi:hypothetical protein